MYAQPEHTFTYVDSGHAYIGESSPIYYACAEPAYALVTFPYRIDSVGLCNSRTNEFHPHNRNSGATFDS